MVETSKAEWVEKADELPDSSFAYVEHGGAVDADGRTAPRSLRHFPYKSADGEVDPAQLARCVEDVGAAYQAKTLPRATLKRVAKRLQAEAAVLKYVSREGDKWVVHAEDGRVLGEHDTRGEAVAQLRAVEASKHDRVAKYSDDQPRDDDGRWSETGAGGGSKAADKAYRDHAKKAGWSWAGEENDYSVFEHPDRPGEQLRFPHEGGGWEINGERDRGARSSYQFGGKDLASLKEHLSDRDGKWAVESQAAQDAHRSGSPALLGSFSPERVALRRHGYERVADETKDPDHAAEFLHPDGHFVAVDHGGGWEHYTPDATDPKFLHLTGEGQDGGGLVKHLNQVHGGSKKKSVKGDAPGSRVQSLVFDKARYAKADEAKAWANDHGFDAGKVEETRGGWRVRQESPDAFARLRTISLTEGVQAVVGFPRAAVKAVQDAFFTTTSGRLAFKAAELDAATFEPVEETESGVVYAVKVADRTLHFAESGGVAVALPAYETLRRLEKSRYVPVAKSEGDDADEKRYTLGVVYPADAADYHGEYMSPEELEKAAWGAMKEDGVGVGLMHRPGTKGAGRMVESYIYRGPDWTVTDAHGEEQVVKAGDWLGGVVWEPAAWAAVKAGQLKGYSLQGLARKVAAE